MLLHPGPDGFVMQAVPVNGCVIVLVGHCTRNDCALAATAAKATVSMEIQTWYDFKWLMVALLREYYEFGHQPAGVRRL